MLTTYRLDQTYDWNFQNGPEYDGAFPPVPATSQKDFFGIPVNSRLGIAAGLLLNSRWISTYARLGFDILTYKTVRSSYRRCYDLPNWILIDTEGQIDPSRLVQQLLAPRSIQRIPEAEDVVLAVLAEALAQRRVASVLAEAFRQNSPRESRAL